MFCPKCGNELDLFADKCLSCGKNFRGMSLAQRQKLQRKPFFQKSKPKAGKEKSSFTKQLNAVKGPVTTSTRIEYNNGYATPEGMSITGKRLRKGSFKKRPNNEGTGFRLPSYGLGEYPY